MDFNAFTNDQLRQYLSRRNVDYSTVVERSELLDLAQNQAVHREAAEKKLVNELLHSVHMEVDAKTRIDKLESMMRRVKTKPAKRDLKKALGFQYTKRAFSQMQQLEREFGEHSRETTPEVNDELKIAEAFFSIAVFYDKKNAEAYGGRGLCRVRRGQLGAGLKDVATAVTFKDDASCWSDMRMCDSFEQCLKHQRELYKFGRWQKLTLDPSPPGRFFPAYCHDNAGKMYVYGGESAVPNEWHGPELADLWELDTTREPMAWSRVHFSADSDRLPPLKKSGMCCIKGVLYIFGGETEDQESNRLYSIHLGTRRCKRLKTSGLEPGRRASVALFERNGALAMYGGSKEDADVWHCNLAKLRWSRQHTKVGSCAGSSISERDWSKPPDLGEFSWWYDRERDALLVWAKAGSLGMPWAGGERIVQARWECSLGSGEWSRVPFRGYAVPPFLERSCCSSGGGGGGGEGARVHWGFGGYSDIWYHDVARADADGVVSYNVQQCAYYNDIVEGDADGAWHYVVPVGLEDEPMPSGGSAIAPLEGGGGFVMFGGYHTYGEDMVSFSFPKHLAETWVFRLCEDSSTALVRARVQAGTGVEAAMEAARLSDREGEVATTAARGSRAAGAAGLRQFNITLYMEAVRQLAKTAGWRERLSLQSVAGCAAQGKGVLLAPISMPPLPCHQLLAAVRFVPAAMVAGEMNSERDRADAADTLASLAPARQFIVAIQPGPDFAEEVRATVPVRFYSFGNAPGVGELGPDVVYVDEPGVASQQLTPEVQRVLDAATSDTVWEAAAVSRSGGGGLAPAYEKCGNPECSKVRVLNAHLFSGAITPSQGVVVATLLRCKQCQLVAYCGKECQGADWKRHKKACKQAVASGAAASPKRGQWNDSLLAAASGGGGA